MSDSKLYFGYFYSPLGEIEIVSSDTALLSLKFVIVGGKSLDKQPPLSSPINEKVKNQLDLYFSKQIKNFDLPLKPAGTDFQKEVWNQLLKIPYGTTVSYLSLAKKLGDENAIRAVAAANGKNPIAIVIPCHRVIGSDGKLVGYSGDLARKKWLIEHESFQESLF